MIKLSQHEVTMLLIQLGIMLITGRVFAEFARAVRQPGVVGEILAGIVLGPTVFGMFFPELFNTVFGTGNSALVLDGIVQVAVVMLLFIAGLEVDLNIVIRQGRQALLTSSFGLVIPFVLGAALPFLMPELLSVDEDKDLVPFALFMGTSMAITALPVIARILMDIDLFKTKIGMLIISSAMITDLVGWLVFSVVLGLIATDDVRSPLLYTILLTLGFALFMLTIGRWLINRLLPWINKSLAWPGGVLSLSLALCFLAGALTEFIGIHAIFGAFLFGVALGDSVHMSERAKEIVHQFINNVFAPFFFVAIGLKVNFITNFDLLLTVIIVVVAFAGKIAGSTWGTRLGGFSLRESFAAGFGMNARGAMEIILGIVALESGLINETVFVSLVIMALITSMSSGPMMKWVLK